MSGTGELTPKKLEQINKARSADRAKPLLYPLIDKRIETIITQACGELKAGKSDFVAQIAQISALRDIKWEIDRIQKQGNKIAEEMGNATSTGN